MDIKVKDCISSKETKVLYAYFKRLDENGVIDSLKCFDKGSGENKWIRASELSQKILKGELFVYAGNYNDSDKKFENVCIVVPMIKDGEYYITSITDDKKTNNLENLPLLKK